MRPPGWSRLENDCGSKPTDPQRLWDFYDPPRRIQAKNLEVWAAFLQAPGTKEAVITTDGETLTLIADGPAGKWCVFYEKLLQLRARYSESLPILLRDHPKAENTRRRRKVAAAVQILLAPYQHLPGLE